MEVEPRRWAVTYTKQLKQKRKAYQDGALLFYPDSGRLVLLDDAGKTIESRFLRASEEVSHGAALLFQSHLVDVGEPQRQPTGRSGSSAPAASRTAYRGGATARHNAVKPPVPRAFVNPQKSGGGKSEAANSGGAGVAAYGGAGAANSTLQEWCVMYTIQLTQKAKKFHDGFLKLVQIGSRAKQIVLLDEEGEVLGTRYLKSEECVESGKKCNFPNYLIEIDDAKNQNRDGEPLSSKESLVPKKPKTGQNATNKMEMGATSSLKFFSPQKFHCLHESKSEVTSSSDKTEPGKIEVAAAGSTGSLMGSVDSSSKEWSVLYTTQLTQKAKKYHDGVIRLMQVGSQSKQIVLLDEDGGVLGSRYLKSGESVESGTKCQFPNYLIDVVELRNQRNDLEAKHSPEEALSHAGPDNGENASEKTGDRSKSPKFVSPFKLNDLQKSKSKSATGSYRPQAGKSTSSNMDNLHVLESDVFMDLQRGKPDSTINYRRTDLGKSTLGNMEDPHKVDDIYRGKSQSTTSYNCTEVGKSRSNRIDDPLEFRDLQDDKLGLPSSFVRREVGKSTFSSMDDPLRTASQILSIMKPPSGLSHFASQLRTSVQSCLKLDTVQTKNSISTHHQHGSSGDAYPTYDHQAIMKPAAFDGAGLGMVDIPTSDMSSAEERKLDSSNNHHAENSNGSVAAMNLSTTPGLWEDKIRTTDKISANKVLVDQKCGSGPLLTPSILTLKDSNIQRLIDDCPSFDLGF